MLFSTCPTCGRQIDRSARICPQCGALTGVRTPSNDKPVAEMSSFIAAVVVGLIALVLAIWAGLLP
ncbi:zinc-ribbon domain-containing protein [Methylobacterium sp. J-070]|uniref:zinc-ribbon domain-containing protein n=1 Tax=Methylobacterium sp. J-070 TaxID=2836650 RepID=UPI00391C794B